jgi:hypothetical protein
MAIQPAGRPTAANYDLQVAVRQDRILHRGCLRLYGGAELIHVSPCAAAPGIADPARILLLSGSVLSTWQAEPAGPGVTHRVPLTV